MADRFESILKEKTRLMKDGDTYKRIHMHRVDYEKMKRTDRCLKRAYDLLFQHNMEKYPRLVRITEELIARLESQPHLYCPFAKVETTGDHVTRWLNNHTANPVAELHGFTSRDPYEPKSFIPTLSTSMSHSDTNILLGKRKRNDDMDVEGGPVYWSSSDTRLICGEWCRQVNSRIRF